MSLVKEDCQQSVKTQDANMYAAEIRIKGNMSIPNSSSDILSGSCCKANRIFIIPDDINLTYKRRVAHVANAWQEAGRSRFDTKKAATFIFLHTIVFRLDLDGAKFKFDLKKIALSTLRQLGLIMRTICMYAIPGYKVNPYCLKAGAPPPNTGSRAAPACKEVHQHVVRDIYIKC